MANHEEEQNILQPTTIQGVDQGVPASIATAQPDPQEVEPIQAAPSKLQALDFLQSEGVNAKLNNKGETTLFNPETGEDEPFDAVGFLQSEGVIEDASEVVFNTPNTAIPVSPLSEFQRTILGTAEGRKKDSLKFLNSIFEEAKYDPQLGLVALNKGVWGQVDPDILAKDPWEITKDVLRFTIRKAVPALKGIVDPGEFDKDLAQIQAANLPVIVGGVGGLIGGPLGAGIGGAAGKKIQTSLGRLYGTYNETPIQESQDVAFDGLMQLGFGLIGKAIPLAKSGVEKVLSTKLGKDAVGAAIKVGEKLHINDMGRYMKALGQNASESVKKRYSCNLE